LAKKELLEMKFCKVTSLGLVAQPVKAAPPGSKFFTQDQSSSLYEVLAALDGHIETKFLVKHLLIMKVDCRLAYQRIHLLPLTASVKLCICMAVMLLVTQHMMFGGPPKPSQWSNVSVVVANLANDPVWWCNWNPYYKLKSPHNQHLLATNTGLLKIQYNS
jgi:hypothetical protein